MTKSKMGVAMADAGPLTLPCPTCGAAVRVRGACLGCLLRTGLLEPTNADSAEFAAVLAELGPSSGR